jgi:hypothetical protein
VCVCVCVRVRAHVCGDILVPAVVVVMMAVGVVVVVVVVVTEQKRFTWHLGTSTSVTQHTQNVDTITLAVEHALKKWGKPSQAKSSVTHTESYSGWWLSPPPPTATPLPLRMV